MQTIKAESQQYVEEGYAQVDDSLNMFFLINIVAWTKNQFEKRVLKGIQEIAKMT